MMNRFRLVGVALFALFAFGVLTAVSASAAPTFLLAEWLVGGSAVTAELAAEGVGELLLEDTALKADVLCSVIGDGWVGPNSLGFVSEVLSLAGVLIGRPLTGASISCEAQSTCAGSPAPVVWPVGLPYEGEVDLMEDGGQVFFAVLGLSVSPGWEIECTILGVKSSDECTSSNNAAELSLEGVTLLIRSSEAFTLLAEGKLGKCSFAGGETGILEGAGVITLLGGGELTASSEGVVS